MKSFLAIFNCAENSENHEAWKRLSPEEQKDRMKKGMQSWQQWNEKYKDRILYDGGTLGEETKIIDSKGITDIPSQRGAFLVIEANSLDEAAKIFSDHPHFAIFPGDGVEILERINTPRGPQF